MIKSSVDLFSCEIVPRFQPSFVVHMYVSLERERERERVVGFTFINIYLLVEPCDNCSYAKYISAHFCGNVKVKRILKI